MNTFQFPKNFLWGAATSSHQVEGDNFHNDWWEWEQTGRLQEKSAKACDHWNLFREDFKLAKSLHHNAHRFSIEWSRVEPEEGVFDEQALAHYKTVLQTLKDEQLEPVVTLHHFTLPLWLARQGGWVSKKTPAIFARYARKVIESIGDGVSFWVTINEPEIYIYKSYLTGEWPPGETHYDQAYEVAKHLLKGHVLAYAAMKEVVQTLHRKEIQVGIAKHVSFFTPCSNRWKDRLSTWLRSLIFNHLFIKALIQGRAFYPGFFHVRLPHGDTLDFIGLNYYTRDYIHHCNFLVPGIFGDPCPVKHKHEIGKQNFLKWEIYPEGLYHLVKDFSKYKLPILITENGICTDRDEERTQFVAEHLSALAKAMEEGAPVIGYLYWSLLDNFEWAEGFSPRFGFVEVDFETQQRKIRPSANMFSRICQTGTLLSQEVMNEKPFS